MSTAGQTVELRRYRIPAGQRAGRAQRIDGRVAVIDVPVDHADRVHLIERHVHSYAELVAVASIIPTELLERAQLDVARVADSFDVPADAVASTHARWPHQHPT